MDTSATGEEERDAFSLRTYPGLPTGWEDRTLGEVDGVLFCRWRGPAAPVSKADQRIWLWISGLGLGGGVFIYALQWGTTVLLHPPMSEHLRLLGIGVLAMIVASFAVGNLLIQRLIRRSPKSSYEEAKKARPAGAPEGAIYLRALMETNGVSEGLSHGWLWVDGPWLNFVGDRFDFRLHAQDVDLPSRFRPDLRQVTMLPLIVAEGAPPRTLVVTPGRPGTKKAEATAIQKAIATWQKLSTPGEASLYPPLEPPATALALRVTTAQWLTMALAYVVGCIVAYLVLPRIPGKDLLSETILWLLVPTIFAFYAKWESRRKRRTRPSVQTSRD